MLHGTDSLLLGITYQPNSEMGNHTVYWMVAKLGFLIGWDKQTWLVRSVWTTTSITD